MKYLETYSPIIKEASPSQIRSDSSLSGKLIFAKEGKLQVNYAPFDYVNSEAKIALVGITPGRQQATNALLALNAALNEGDDLATAAKKAKEFGSFSGPMRKNLIASLDSIGLARKLGIASTAELWGSRTDIVHFTSGVMYPTYVLGSGEPKNWNGHPRTAKSVLLSKITRERLGEEIRKLAANGAIIVALGDKAFEAVECSGSSNMCKVTQIPHPSPANNERIAYFNGHRPREHCSKMVDTDKLDKLRDVAKEIVATM